MARAKTTYRCQRVRRARSRSGRAAARPARRGAPWWRSVVAPAARRGRVVGPSARGAPPHRRGRHGRVGAAATHVGELDRVLQGGLVPGSVTVLGGEPGIGKSTLLLQALAGLAKAGQRCLYVTAEESAQQVRLRAERLGALPPHLWLVSDTALPARARPHRGGRARRRGHRLDPDRVRSRPELGARARSRRCASARTASCGSSKERAHERRCSSATSPRTARSPGPRVLEHLVDTVLSFEGERHHALRLLRAVKHRFGSTDELGLFEMTDGGLEGVPDPSALFLADRRPGTPGSVVAPVLDGHRPLLVEVQALVARHRPPDAAPLGPGPRQRPPRAGRRRAAAARAAALRQARRAHRRRRRRDGGRAGRRPRAGAGARVGARRASPCPPTSSRAARSASAASCARCTRRPAGSPRRPASGSGAPSCRRARRSSCPTSRCSGSRTLDRGRAARLRRRPARAPRVLSRRRARGRSRTTGSIGRWRLAAVGRAHDGARRRGARARRCATGSTASSRRRWAASWSWATAPRC